MDETTTTRAASSVDPDFATPALTLASLRLADLRDLEDRARRAGDDDLRIQAQRAQDQLAAYRAGDEYDDDALRDCLAALNEQQAIIDQAFARADQLVQELLAERNSFAERKAWRSSLVGGR